MRSWWTGLVAAHVLFGAVLAVTADRPAAACDTPVYRYAMYRWHPTPYEVYFFHRRSPTAELQTVLDRLRSEADRADGANVLLLPVNLDEDPDLVAVPADVKQAWQKQSGRDVPAFLVVSPLGQELYCGPLSEEDAVQLVDSPARQRIAQQLQQGDALVFVLLASGRAEADGPVEQQIRQVIDDVAEGRIELYQPPAPPGAGGLPGEESRPEQEAGLNVSLVRVERGDPAERWLVRQLVAADPQRDLPADEPAVFAVYGRGRLLPPCVGEQIDRQMLTSYVEFVTGACSCTVKEQNPGVDLLMRCDWEAAAAKLAARFGTEEGNERVLGIEQFFPDLLFGPETAPMATDEASLSESQGRSGSEVEANSGSPEPIAPVAEAGEQTTDSDGPASEQPSDTRVALASATTGGDPTAEAAANSPEANDASRVLLVTLAIGLAIALVACGAATWGVLVRRR